MIALIIGYLILLIVYLECPFYLKNLIMIVNALIPDPIPFVDEIIMITMLFKRIGFIKMIIGWGRKS